MKIETYTGKLLMWGLKEMMISSSPKRTDDFSL